jgi:hypothetical protein
VIARARSAPACMTLTRSSKPDESPVMLAVSSLFANSLVSFVDATLWIACIRVK